MALPQDLISRRFGRLTIVGLHSGGPGHTHRRRKCLCDCGGSTISTTGHLTSGHTISCGCVYIERRWKASDARVLPAGEAVFRHLLRIYKSSARKRSHPWDLTNDEFRQLITNRCWYCDSEPEAKSSDRPGSTTLYFSANGIDRIDNAIGYTFANSAPCCEKCNYMKHNLPLSAFLAHIERFSGLSNPLAIFQAA